MTEQELAEAYRKAAADLKAANQAPCSSCGHCPTCGRGGYNTRPYYWPTYPSPWWQVPGPIYTSGVGDATTTGTLTFGSGSLWKDTSNC